jgi:hypothetical protein
MASLESRLESVISNLDDLQTAWPTKATILLPKP